MDIKPLFIAYACEPYHGSEPGVGWHFVAETARRRPVWVITHARHRQGLERYLTEIEPGLPVHVRYVALPKMLQRLENGGYVAFNLAYLLWQVLAGNLAVRWHRQVGFSIAQHVSLVRWWMPTAAARLKRHGVRFVWGPLGAGERITPALQQRLGLRHRLIEWARTATRRLFRFDPRLASTARAADVALCGTKEVVRHLQRLGVGRIEMMPAVAIDSVAKDVAQTPADPRGPFVFCSGGGLIYWKRIDLALRAFAELNLPNAEYHHLCGGEEQPRLEALARRLGIAGRVRFLGEVNYRQCVDHLRRVDVLVHPTLRDSCGLILEAFAAGVPVIGFDVGTAGMLVDDTCGTLIDLRDATEPALQAALKQHMHRAYTDTAWRGALSKGAAARSVAVSRQARGEALERIWQSVLAQPAADTPKVSAARCIALSSA